MRKSLFIVFTLALAALLGSKEALAQKPNDILIVVNASVGDQSATIDTIKSIFLKRQTHWDGVHQIIPISAMKDSDVRDAFRAQVLGMTAAEEERHWQDLKIRSGTSEPTAFSTVLKAVYKVKGAVGYIFRSQFKEGIKGVKVILTIPAK